MHNNLFFIFCSSPVCSNDFVQKSFQIKYPTASYGVFDPRGIRQIDMQACHLGSLLAGIKKDAQGITLSAFAFLTNITVYF